jgi:hypothetical protein
MKPVRAGIFWTGGCSPLSLGIRWFTRPGYRPGLAEVNHTGLVFCDGMGPQEIHEALFSEGYCVKPFAKLAGFMSRPHTRVEFGWLPHGEASVRTLYDESMSYVGWKSYAADQIVAFMLCRSLLGRALHLTLDDDPTRVICSEAVGRIVFEALGLDLRETLTQSFDSLSPQGTLDRWRGMLH